MQTPHPRPIAAVHPVSNRTRETMFHMLFVLLAATAAWIVTGSLDANGQTFETQSPLPYHSPLQTIEPGIGGEFNPSDYGDDRVYLLGETSPPVPHRILQPPAANPLRTPPSAYSSSPYSSLPYSSSSYEASQSTSSQFGPAPAGPAPGHPAPSHHAAATHAKHLFNETLHTDGPLLRRLHEHRQPAPPVIPEATVAPQWKTPYAYGYFGASNTRHWTKSYGFRDTYKRWSKQ